MKCFTHNDLIRPYLFLFVWIAGFNCTFFPGHSNTGPYTNTAPVGTSAGYLLDDYLFTELIVEIDFVDGYEPEDSTIDTLSAFLRKYLDKPDGISIILDDSIDRPKKAVDHAEDLYTLEKKHRDYFPADSSLTIYILILDEGEIKDHTDGIAYLNTSIAVFFKPIRENFGKIGQPETSTVESAVLLHEFGHLLGLVNKGIRMKTEHQAKNRGAHCTVDSCLMHSPIKTSDGNWNLNGGIIPDLCEFCRMDLEAAREIK